MGDFFEVQCKFADVFNPLKLTDGEMGLLTGIMIMNAGWCAVVPVAAYFTHFSNRVLHAEIIGYYSQIMYKVTTLHSIIHIVFFLNNINAYL